MTQLITHVKNFERIPFGANEPRSGQVIASYFTQPERLDMVLLMIMILQRVSIKMWPIGHYYTNIIFSFMENDTHCKYRYGCTSKYQKVPKVSKDGLFMYT